MADSGINISLGKETSKYLSRLAKVKKRSVQELAEEFIQEAIENEEDTALVELSIKRNTPDAEIVDYEDVKWRCQS
ncbi:hypothetical protein [Wolbachia endosymbiont of Ctenocephalides felis wCfeJ]|uniref:hypothetical protein n=1 Tax=Wolbachia endosymbiont of Ctenocephalides felis wCfeJ TaxID=2732594 RepID=UPI00144548FD|nr:hypothetical protein [Wolbachia endosymbiont of Ctenocephalides felis wCfeJ]WCR58272.1 MAG: hypothetical protein PG980_000744 [Wolbachia endosymbiont of Ctenocephalides felis wCfeJ]